MKKKKWKKWKKWGKKNMHKNKRRKGLVLTCPPDWCWQLSCCHRFPRSHTDSVSHPPRRRWWRWAARWVLPARWCTRCSWHHEGNGWGGQGWWWYPAGCWGCLHSLGEMRGTNSVGAPLQQKALFNINSVRTVAARKCTVQSTPPLQSSTHNSVWMKFVFHWLCCFWLFFEVVASLF